MEIFKDIPGYEGKYQITSWGRAYNVDRGSFITPEHHHKGYLRVDLYDRSGNRKHHKVHRLVGMAFVPNPDNKPAVDHINGIKTDNRACNLRWVTNKENINNPVTLPKHILEGKKRVPKMIEASIKRNFGRKRVLVMFPDGSKAEYESLKLASEAVGISQGKMSEILNHKRNQNKRFTAAWKEEP